MCASAVLLLLVVLLLHTNILSYFYRKWLGIRRSCLVVADTADTTVVSAVSATTRYDCFFFLPTKDLAPFSLHIPTKKPLLQ